MCKMFMMINLKANLSRCKEEKNIQVIHIFYFRKLKVMYIIIMNHNIKYNNKIIIR